LIVFPEKGKGRGRLKTSEGGRKAERGRVEWRRRRRSL
jgi:hypothetical protein